MTEIITLDTDYSKDLTVYRLMKGWQKIHEDYGLWICAGKSWSAMVPVKQTKSST